jgi:hypothetical protein
MKAFVLFREQGEQWAIREEAVFRDLPPPGGSCESQGQYSLVCALQAPMSHGLKESLGAVEAKIATLPG